MLSGKIRKLSSDEKYHEQGENRSTCVGVDYKQAKTSTDLFSSDTKKLEVPNITNKDHLVKIYVLRAQRIETYVVLLASRLSSIPIPITVARLLIRGHWVSKIFSDVVEIRARECHGGRNKITCTRWPSLKGVYNDIDERDH